MRLLRWALVGFGIGMFGAFVVSLLRGHSMRVETGYLPPVPAAGPEVALAEQPQPEQAEGG